MMGLKNQTCLWMLCKRGAIGEISVQEGSSTYANDKCQGNSKRQHVLGSGESDCLGAFLSREGRVEEAELFMKPEGRYPYKVLMTFKLHVLPAEVGARS